MNSIKKVLAVLLSSAAMFSFGGCAQNNGGATNNLGDDKVVSAANGKASEQSSKEKAKKTPKQDGSKAEKKADDKEEEPSYSCSFLCAGDNLIHDNIYNEALKNGGGENYDFTKAYENIESYIKGTDVAVINQETLVNDKFEPSSYPYFSTPTAVGDKITDMGFNVISMSNNHVLDKGSEGLINSLDYWDKKNVVHYGAYRDQADSEDIRVKEVNGIKFAFLGYMEHTNYITLNEGEAGKVVYLSEEDKVKEQIEKADKLADVVVVSCHYGTEIQNEINQQQETLTPKMVEWGADLIIGTQAHTVSKCEYLDKPDGGKAFVYYGLGNFISTMYEPRSLVGILGKLNVVKDKDSGAVTFEDVKAIPIISHFEGDSYDSDWYNCTVYPYKDYTDELFEKHFVQGFSRDTVEDCLSYIPKEFLSE